MNCLILQEGAQPLYLWLDSPFDPKPQPQFPTLLSHKIKIQIDMRLAIKTHGSTFIRSLDLFAAFILNPVLAVGSFNRLCMTNSPC